MIRIRSQKIVKNFLRAALAHSEEITFFTDLDVPLSIFPTT
jgi:hypothetical protein